MIKDGFFTSEFDITETLKDGRQIQLLAAGVPIAEAEARRLGFIKNGGVTLPSETKGDDPQEIKNPLSNASLPAPTTPVKKAK